MCKQDEPTAYYDPDAVTSVEGVMWSMSNPLLVRVTKVEPYGSVWVGLGSLHNGRRVAFVGDWRLMARLREELNDDGASVCWASVPRWAMVPTNEEPPAA